jgi:hypothetical protein
VSIFILLQAGSTPIGGFMAGYLSDVAGVGQSVAIQAICCGLGVFVAAAYLWRCQQAPVSASADQPWAA